MAELITIALWVLYFIALYFSIFLFSIFLFEPESNLKALKRYPLVSVIIPAWNEEKGIKETVYSALSLDYPKGKLEIIAVDHGSSDNTGKILDSIKGIEVIHLKRKEGDNKAVAFNSALKCAKGEFVACLDADSTVYSGALKNMLKHFEESEKVAVVTPMMMVKSPKNLLQHLQRFEYITSLFIKRLTSYINCIYVAPGPFSIYRADVLKKLGGFDEKAIAEDMEIVYRLQQHQYIARQCLEGGFSYATAPSTLRELYKQRQRWYGGSLSNLCQYRKLAFNKSYGDFGFFQMPRNLLGILTVFTMLGFFSYFTVRPLLNKAYQFFIIKFDVMPYISNYSFNVSIFDLKNAHGLFVGIILAVITLFFFVYACHSVGERFNKKDIPTLIVFFTAYPLLLCLMYFAVIIKKAARRKFVWNKMGR